MSKFLLGCIALCLLPSLGVCAVIVPVNQDFSDVHVTAENSPFGCHFVGHDLPLQFGKLITTSDSPGFVVLSKAKVKKLKQRLKLFAARSGENFPKSERRRARIAKSTLKKLNTAKQECRTYEFAQAPSGTPQPTPTVNTTIVWPPGDLESRKLYAYSWGEIPQTQQYDHVFSFFWIYDQDQAYNHYHALQTTNAMPPGHHVTFAANYTGLYMNSADRCTDAHGNPVTVTMNSTVSPSSIYLVPEIYQGAQTGNPIVNTAMPCLWLDNGRLAVKSWYEQFLGDLKDAGGSIDVLVLDDELFHSFGGWELAMNHQWCQQNPGLCQKSWCQAIAEDPRFPPQDFPAEILDLQNTVCNTSSPNFAHYFLTWDAYIRDRLAQDATSAIYTTAAEYFPNIKVSSYGVYHWNENYNVLENGSQMYLYGDGSQVGTHQSQELYGGMPPQYALPDAGLGFLTQSPFNAFKHQVNKMRSMYLSSDAPIHPWIPLKSYFPSMIDDSDLYQELMYHAAMTGTDQFLLWSWLINIPSNDFEVVNQVLAELQPMIGYTSATPLATNLSPWESDYVLTGMQVGEYKVWRYTPLLKPGESITDAIQNAGASDGSANVILSTPKGETLAIPHAMIFNPVHSASQQGLWIVAR